jgi:hypothetical protein
MLPIPGATTTDLAFSNDSHMPKYKDVPNELKLRNNKYVDFVSGWFFCGRTKEDMDRLIPKKGVDEDQALRAIKAALGSWGPEHEHREAGCAYMTSKLFDLNDGTPANADRE